MIEGWSKFMEISRLFDSTRNPDDHLQGPWTYEMKLRARLCSLSLERLSWLSSEPLTAFCAAKLGIFQSRKTDSDRIGSDIVRGHGAQ